MNLENFRNVFETEIESLKLTLSNLDLSVDVFVEAMLAVKGKLIVSGIGKSGLIGRKISATLASTGTESFFIHSTEAFHGDLGMINNLDAVLLLSNSGETDEVLRVLNYCITNGILTFSITGNINSTLAKNSNFHLLSSITKEACLLNLAPTSSTTTMLVLGDALAVALMNRRNFHKIDFAKYHPGGSLGLRLLGKVKDYMTTFIPEVNSSSNIVEVIEAISTGGFGVCVVVDKVNNDLIGVITDGDIRRHIQETKNLKLDMDILKITNSTPKKVDSELDLVSCDEFFQKHRINVLLVEKYGEIVGLISRFNLPK